MCGGEWGGVATNYSVQEYKLYVLKDLVQIRILTSTSHTTLDELVNLSGPQFPHSSR